MKTSVALLSHLTRRVGASRRVVAAGALAESNRDTVGESSIGFFDSDTCHSGFVGMPEGAPLCKLSTIVEKSVLGVRLDVSAG
jgi:hypothetical protein